MGEALLQAKMPDKKVSSAGVRVLIDHPADPNTLELLADINIDHSSHRAKQLTRDLMLESDLILAMDTTHVEITHDMFSESRGKVHLVGKWKNDLDIIDPHRQGKAAFKESFEIINECLELWKDKI